MIVEMGSLLISPPTSRWAALRERYLGRTRVQNRRVHSRSLRGGQQVHRFRGGLGVTAQRIWVSALPEGFRGFRILQLSDIHHSLFVPLDHVAAVVELSNRLKPDLIALTGDFVTYSRASIEPVAEILGGLGGPAGVLAVPGNYDFRGGAGHRAGAAPSSDRRFAQSPRPASGEWRHAAHRRRGRLRLRRRPRPGA